MHRDEVEKYLTHFWSKVARTMQTTVFHGAYGELLRMARKLLRFDAGCGLHAAADALDLHIKTSRMQREAPTDTVLRKSSGN